MKQKKEPIYKITLDMQTDLDKSINQLCSHPSDQTKEVYKQLLQMLYKDNQRDISFYIHEQLLQHFLKEDYIREACHGMLPLLSEVTLALWASPLMSCPDSLREHFFENLFLQHQYFNNFFQYPYEADMQESVRTWTAYYNIMLNSYSSDLFVFQDLWSLSEPLPVCCEYCRDDTHSLTVLHTPNADKIKKREFIRDTGKESAHFEPEEWDIFQNTMPYLHSLKETKLSTWLPRLYGTYRCEACGREQTVIEAYKNWLFWNQKLYKEPEEALIDWLIEFGNSKLNVSYQEMLFYHKMALNYLHSQKNPSILKLAQCWLKISTDYTFLYRYKCQIAYAKQAVELLEGPKEEYEREKQLLLAEAYRRLGIAWCADFEHMENNDFGLSMECYQHAIQIFDKILGEGNEKSKLIEQNIAVARSNFHEDVGESIGALKKQIREEKKKENPDREEIAENYKIIADMYAEGMNHYKKAAHYYQYYLEEMKVVYGAESDYVADCYEDLADYYEEDGDFVRACECCEHALEINIREMGKIYLLPPIFKGLLVNVLTKAGKIDSNDKYTRCMSASDSYRHVGELYLETGEEKRALKSFEKALELHDWVLETPTVEKGDLHRLKAEAMEALNREEDAKQEYEQALRIYQVTVRNNVLEGNKPLFQSETEECIENIRALREKLGKSV